MTDSEPEDAGWDAFDCLRRRPREQSRTRPLEVRMREFARNHEMPDDLTQLREDVKTGNDLSAIVKLDRGERP